MECSRVSIDLSPFYFSLMRARSARLIRNVVSRGCFPGVFPLLMSVSSRGPLRQEDAAARSDRQNRRFICIRVLAALFSACVPFYSLRNRSFRSRPLSASSCLSLVQRDKLFFPAVSLVAPWRRGSESTAGILDAVLHTGNGCRCTTVVDPVVSHVL